MSKSNLFETNLLKLIFQNIALAAIGDASGLQPSALGGSLYIGLHTADPGEGGDQSTSEATYGSYARVAVVRSVGGWSVVNGVASNAAAVSFPSSSSGSNTITHFSIGTSPTGAGTLLYSGALSPAVTITTGIAPLFPIGLITTAED